MHAPIPPGLIDRLETGLALLDSGWHVLWLNSALAEALHVGARSLRGQAFGVLLEDDSLLDTVAAALAAGESLSLRGVAMTTLRGERMHADLHLQRLDADQVLLEAHVLAAPAPSPTPLSATLRGFAHEVKNPLAGLRGAAQLLQRRVGDADLQALCAVLLAETERLTTLADRLLQQRGGAALGAVNLHEILERIATLLGGETQALRVRHDYDPSLPALHGDADRLHQLLLNLVRNAVDAGAVELTLRTRVEHGVRLRERVARTAVRVDVADDGAGVAVAVRDTLFEPLVSGHQNGTGLGLALAREIAHEHGGELRYASRPGATVFSLHLPLEPGHA